MFPEVRVFKGQRGFSVVFDSAKVERPCIYEVGKDRDVVIKCMDDNEMVAVVRIDKDLLVKIAEDAEKVMEVPR